LKIISIEIDSFRNLLKQKFSAHPIFNIFIGDNAQGKTSFLEITYFISHLRSFRTQQLKDVINFERDRSWFRVILSKENIDYEIIVEIKDSSKIILVNGKEIKSFKSYHCAPNLVLFYPDELFIPKGGPKERRRLIDRAVIDFWPHLIEEYHQYDKVLKSRNKVLIEKMIGYEKLLDVYDIQLSSIGASLVRRRIKYLLELNPIFKNIFSHLDNIERDAYLNYVEYDSLENENEKKFNEIEEKIHEQLKKNRSQDIRLKKTSIGPHLDKIDFIINGKDARSFASQGQIRTLMLSFKIAQMKLFYKIFKYYPMLLLDDVSSELDKNRNRFLFEEIRGMGCQTFITTTHRNQILIEENFKDVRVDGGMLTEVL